MKKRSIALTSIVFGIASAAQAGFGDLPNGFDIVITYEDGTTWSASNSPGSISDVDQNGDVFDVEGSWTESGAFKANWNISFDPDPFISSSFNLTNMSGSAQNFVVEVFTPATPPVAAPSVMEGAVAGSLLDANNSGGAMISTIGGSAWYEALIDGNVVRSLYPDPDSISIPDGVANIPSMAFGPEAGPAAMIEIGIRNSFTLSPGDSAQFVSFFEVVPTPGTAAILGLSSLTVLRRRRGA